MLKILVASTFLVLALVVIKDGRALERYGVLGSCHAVATPAGKAGYWYACRAGRIDGQPDLSLRPCTAHHRLGSVDYWRCPTPLDADRS
jgi:hypothetical protein